MNGLEFSLTGTTLTALPSGALWWAAEKTLAVSDLHFGKTDRTARRRGTMLPPYEVQETLSRLQSDISTTNPATVICLGDSFDDLAAADSLTDAESDWITRLQAGRHWIWIEGNHDPGPLHFGGTHLGEFNAPPLTFRHIAKQEASGEVSGHYHPKTSLHARGKSITRACFLIDDFRLIMPAYGTYTGGLRSNTPALADLMSAGARAILTGPTPLMVPLPGRSPGAPRPSRDKTD